MLFYSISPIPFPSLPSHSLSYVSKHNVSILFEQGWYNSVITVLEKGLDKIISIQQKT